MLFCCKSAWETLTSGITLVASSSDAWIDHPPGVNSYYFSGDDLRVKLCCHLTLLFSLKLSPYLITQKSFLHPVYTVSYLMDLLMWNYIFLKHL